MNKFFASFSSATVAFFLLAATGCNKSDAPPEPIALDKVQPQVQEQFKGSSAETKAIADRLVAALQKQDFSSAYVEVKALTIRPDLTEDQRTLISQAMTAINKGLQEAAAKGDAQAARTLEFHMRTK